MSSVHRGAQRTQTLHHHYWKHKIHVTHHTKGSSTNPINVTWCTRRCQKNPQTREGGNIKQINGHWNKQGINNHRIHILLSTSRMPRIVQTSKAVRQTAEQNKSPVLSYKTPRVRVEHTQKSYARYKMQRGQFLRIKTPHSPTCGSQACGYDPQTPSGRVTSKIGRESQIEP